MKHEEITFLIQDNPDLKVNRYAYEMALNYIDHMCHVHQRKNGKVKWFNDDSVISTPYILPVTVGDYFNSGLIVSELKVKDNKLIENEYIKQDRKYLNSENVFKDFYNFRKASHHYGGTSNYKVFAIATETLIDISEKYEHIIGPANALQFLTYSSLHTKTFTFIDVNKSALDFTRDVLYKWDYNSSYSTFLNSLDYDFNQAYNQNYDDYIFRIIEINKDLISIIKKVRSGKIQTVFKEANLLNFPVEVSKPNTLLYFSNILTYSRLQWDLPIIQADLIFNEYMSQLHDTSSWIGTIPYVDSKKVNKKDHVFKINQQLNTPWRKELFKNYYIPSMKKIIHEDRRPKDTSI